MKVFLSPRVFAALLLLVLAAFALNAHAALSSAGVLDTVLERYRNAAAGWSGVIERAATWLFWTMAAISLGFTFGFMALRRAELSEFFTELVRFIMSTGFFLWLLMNATDFAPRILNGLRQLAGEAGNLGSGALSPSQIVDIGFAIFYRVVQQSSGWSPIDSAAGMLASAAILVMLVLVGINILLVLIGGWVLTFGGQFYLGFGGGRWTTDMAIGYYRSVFKVGMELMTMVLLVAIGSTFLNDYYRNLGGSTRITDLIVVVVASLIMLVLVNKVPPLISSVASGGPVGGSGLGGLGTGALMGGAGMGMAAAATGATLMSAAAAHAMGGVQALQAAFHAAGSSGGGAGGGAGGGMPGLGWTGGSGGGGGSSGGAGGGGGGSSSSTSTPFANAAGFSGGSSGTSLAPASSGSSGTGGAGGGSTGGSSADKPSFGQRMSAVRDQLARGAQAVAVEKMREGAANFAERVAETPGAKVAEAIRAANGTGADPAQASGPTFGADSLSTGDDESVFDPEAEVAAFTAGAEEALPAGPVQGTVDDEGMFDTKKD